MKCWSSVFFSCTNKAKSRRKKGKSTGKWARIYEARPSKYKYHTNTHTHVWPIRESTQNKNMVKRTTRRQRQRQRHCWYETTSCDLICARMRAKHIVCSAAHQTITGKIYRVEDFFVREQIHSTAQNAIMENYWLSINAIRGIWNGCLERVQTLNLTSYRHQDQEPKCYVQDVCVCFCVCTDGQYDMRFVCVFLARFFKWTFVVFSFLFLLFFVDCWLLVVGVHFMMVLVFG